MAALIGSAFEQAGVEAVLSGGSAVTIHTLNRYRSDDLDFITPATRSELEAIMEPLGFRREGKNFIHPASKYFVEFPGRVVNVAQWLVRDFMTIKTPLGSFRILPPTYCAMDRLAQYIAYGGQARETLDQAVMVAMRHRLRYKLIQQWATEQGAVAQFQEFRAALAKERKKTAGRK